MAKSQSANEDVLVALEGRSCDYCEGGTLVADTYKGNSAVVCEDCGTPEVQVW